MSSPKHKVLLICTLAFVTSLFAETNDTAEKKDRITILEARLAELEVRLSEAEQRAKVAEQTAIQSALQAEEARKDNATGKVPKSSIHDSLLWTHKKQWHEIKPGVSIEKVIELLGPPPRSLDSLKPRVDKVFFYQTKFQKSPGSLHGKISFRKGKVLAVEKPDFEQTASMSN
jgi:hypothetical protein